jgi:hypothetical protein
MAGKQCTICEEFKPFKDFYSRKAISKKMGEYTYYHPECKKCSIEKNGSWNKENKEARSAIQITYQNKPTSRKKERDFKQEVRDSGKYLEWQHNNPDKIRTYNKSRRMHKTHEISETEWVNALSYFDHSCAYCGIHEDMAKIEQGHGLHKEHIDPEGVNDISNNIPSCRRCNSSKRAKEFDLWYNIENVDYSEFRYHRILNWIDGDYIRYKE